MLCFQAQKDYKFNLVLLDDRKFQFTYKGSQSCHQLLHDTVKLFNFSQDEMEYFGFRFIDANSQVRWINLNKTVQSQFKSVSNGNAENTSNHSNEMIVYFSVKYYQPDPCKLNNESTRYLFYMQLRKDILCGRLPLQFDYAVDLFSYFLQSELGDYHPVRDSHGYASEFEFMPNQSAELETAVEAKHAKLKGMNAETAEMNFLNKAKWLDMYGVDLKPAVGEDNVEYFIGLTPTGISVYQNKIKINSYFWPRISKLDYKGNKFVLTVIEKTSEEKAHIFVLNNKIQCKHLWKCCYDHHRFFRIKTVYEEPAKLSTAVVTNKRKSLNEGSNSRVAFNRIPTKRVPRRQFDPFNKADEDAIIIDVNKICISEKLENDNNLVFKPIENLVNQGGLFGSSSNITEIQNLNNQPKSPTASAKSVSSYKCPNPRRESASEGEFGSRRRYGGRNRSRTRRNQPEESSDQKKTESDSENEKLLQKQQQQRRSSKHRTPDPSDRRMSGHRRRRSHSRTSTKTSHPDWSILPQKQTSRSRKSLNGQSSGANLIDRIQNYNEHETSMDEIDYNEMEKKRQIRRRKRSKSPGATTKLPEEILQHINYNLVEQSGLNADQLREIPFVKVETTAAPFRISPHQKHRRYSPGRRKSGDFRDSKSSIAYLSNGTAHIKKTKTNFMENLDSGVAIPNVISNPVSMGSAVNTKLVFKEPMTDFTEPCVNIGFSADSGCEDMVIKQI